MAILELGIELNGVQLADKGLKDLQKTLSSMKEVKIDVGVSSIKEANIAIKEMVAVANIDNAKFLTGLKGEGIQLKNELVNVTTELKKVESASKIDIAKGISDARVETEKSRKALIDYNLEQKKLKDSSKKPLDNIVAGEGSIVKMRQRLNELRKVYDNLSASQRNSSRVQNNLVAEINRINQAVSQAEQATGRFQRNVGNYSSALGNASGVTMEFNRIIQDAPFGMMGIGNNIQQLAANWGMYTQQAKQAAAANGQVVTTKQLLSGVMSSFLTTGNLLTFGIAAVTSAWTYYSMNVKTAKEETKDMNNQFTTQISQLQNITALTQKSAKTERDKATAISEYNKTLGETLGKVRSYGELEQKLIKNGSSYVQYLSLKSQAEATYQIALKRTTEMMNNIMSLESKGRSAGFLGWVAKASDTIDELVYGEGSQGKTKITADEARRIAQLPTDKEFYIAIRGMGDALKRGLKDVRADWKKQIQASGLGSDLTQEANKIADAIGGIPMPDLNFDKNGNLSKNTSKLKESFDYLQKIKELLSDKQQELDLFGLSGQAKELQQLSNSYTDFYNELEKLRKKALKDKNAPSGTVSAIDDAILTGQELENKQTLKILEDFENQRLSLIQESNDKWGLINSNSRDKDILNLNKYIEEYKQKIIDLGGSIEDANKESSSLKLSGKYKIDIEFYKPALDDLDKEAKKLEDALNAPFNAKNKYSLQKQIDERIKVFETTARQLADIMKSLGIKVDDEQLNSYISTQSTKVRESGDAEWAKKTAYEFSESIRGEFVNIWGSFFQNMETNVEKLGSGISSILLSISDTFSGIIGNINQKYQAKLMEDLLSANEDGIVSLTDNWKQFDSNQKASAILSMAGSLVSSATSKTNPVTQGIGGALSGAATGTAILPGWGTVIGAAIGGVSGFLKGNAAKKAEETQKSQLEQQKRTNALLERMNALAYTSQIIGGKTANGIVSGVNRNEFGEITVRIEGRDLVGSFNRTNTLSGR